MARTANAGAVATATATPAPITTVTPASATAASRTGGRSASRTRSGIARVTRNASRQGRRELAPALEADERTPRATRSAGTRHVANGGVKNGETVVQTQQQRAPTIAGSYPHTRSHTHSHSHSGTTTYLQEPDSVVPSSRTATPSSTVEEVPAVEPRTTSLRGYTPPVTRLREKSYMAHHTAAPTITTFATDGAGDDPVAARTSDRARTTRRSLRSTDDSHTEAPSHQSPPTQPDLHSHSHEASLRPHPPSTTRRPPSHGHRPLTRNLLYQPTSHPSPPTPSLAALAAAAPLPPPEPRIPHRHIAPSPAPIPEAEMETDHEAAPTTAHVLRSMNAGRDVRYRTRRSRTPEQGSVGRGAGVSADVRMSTDRERGEASVAAGGVARARTPENGRSGSGTSGTGSVRKRQRVYGDRFIPIRDGQDLQASYSLIGEEGGPVTPSKSRRRPPRGELHFQKVEEANRTYSRVLRNEVFGDSVPQVEVDTVSPDVPSANSAVRTPPSNQVASALPPASITPSTPSKNLFSYAANRATGSLTPSRTPRSKRIDGVGDGSGANAAGGGGSAASNLNMQSDLYSLSPIRLESQRILQSAKKQPRYINRVPYKVLDAPELADDFYLNLVDWGSSNIVGVGLADTVYMWDAASGEVTNLCRLTDDTVTSVSWIQRGTHLAIGTNKGFVQIWDAQQQRRLRTMTGHTMRVGALAWNDHILTSGSRDRLIYHRDVRSADQHVRTLTGHTQEVCGLKWNTEDGQLASGGNDNNLMIWDKLSETPLFRFSDHTAAVKAIAWSPHRRRLLASGGGTADRTIKFWNTATGQLIKDVDTGSQVCNLAWSQNSDEIVSTHGYSQHQVVVWKYPRMEQIVSLTGHTFRVLYLAMSPDGQSIVTGAGDETLRFWKIFNKKSGAEGRESRMVSSAVIR